MAFLIFFITFFFLEMIQHGQVYVQGYRSPIIGGSIGGGFRGRGFGSPVGGGFSGGASFGRGYNGGVGGRIGRGFQGGAGFGGRGIGGVGMGGGLQGGAGMSGGFNGGAGSSASDGIGGGLGGAVGGISSGITSGDGVGFLGGSFDGNVKGGSSLGGSVGGSFGMAGIGTISGGLGGSADGLAIGANLYTDFWRDIRLELNDVEALLVNFLGVNWYIFHTHLKSAYDELDIIITKKIMSKDNLINIYNNIEILKMVISQFKGPNWASQWPDLLQKINSIRNEVLGKAGRDFSLDLRTIPSPILGMTSRGGYVTDNLNINGHLRATLNQINNILINIFGQNWKNYLPVVKIDYDEIEVIITRGGAPNKDSLINIYHNLEWMKSHFTQTKGANWTAVWPQLWNSINGMRYSIINTAMTQFNVDVTTIPLPFSNNQQKDIAKQMRGSINQFQQLLIKIFGPNWKNAYPQLRKSFEAIDIIVRRGGTNKEDLVKTHNLIEQIRMDVSQIRGPNWQKNVPQLLNVINSFDNQVSMTLKNRYNFVMANHVPPTSPIPAKNYVNEENILPQTKIYQNSGGSPSNNVNNPNRTPSQQFKPNENSPILTTTNHPQGLTPNGKSPILQNRKSSQSLSGFGNTPIASKKNVHQQLSYGNILIEPNTYDPQSLNPDQNINKVPISDDPSKSPQFENSPIVKNINDSQRFPLNEKSESVPNGIITQEFTPNGKSPIIEKRNSPQGSTPSVNKLTPTNINGAQEIIPDGNTPIVPNSNHQQELIPDENKVPIDEIVLKSPQIENSPMVTKRDQPSGTFKNAPNDRKADVLKRPSKDELEGPIVDIPKQSFLRGPSKDKPANPLGNSINKLIGVGKNEPNKDSPKPLNDANILGQKPETPNEQKGFPKELNPDGFDESIIDVPKKQIINSSDGSIVSEEIMRDYSNEPTRESPDRQISNGPEREEIVPTEPSVNGPDGKMRDFLKQPRTGQEGQTGNGLEGQKIDFSPRPSRDTFDGPIRDRPDAQIRDVFKDFSQIIPKRLIGDIPNELIRIGKIDPNIQSKDAPKAIIDAGILDSKQDAPNGQKTGVSKKDSRDRNDEQINTRPDGKTKVIPEEPIRNGHGGSIRNGLDRQIQDLSNEKSKGGPDGQIRDVPAVPRDGTIGDSPDGSVLDKQNLERPIEDTPNGLDPNRDISRPLTDVNILGQKQNAPKGQTRSVTDGPITDVSDKQIRDGPEESSRDKPVKPTGDDPTRFNTNRYIPKDGPKSPSDDDLNENLVVKITETMSGLSNVLINVFGPDWSKKYPKVKIEYDEIDVIVTKGVKSKEDLIKICKSIHTLKGRIQEIKGTESANKFPTLLNYIGMFNIQITTILKTNYNYVVINSPPPESEMPNKILSKINEAMTDVTNALIKQFGSKWSIKFVTTKEHYDKINVLISTTSVTKQMLIDIFVQIEYLKLHIEQDSREMNWMSTWPSIASAIDSFSLLISNMLMTQFFVILKQTYQRVSSPTSMVEVVYGRNGQFSDGS